MRIAVLTSLYPSKPRPREGLFAERRWTRMVARGHQVNLVHPVPLAPPLLARGEAAEYGRMPKSEKRVGVQVHRPRYLHLSGRAQGNAQRFARAAWKALDRLERPEVLVIDYAWPAAAAVAGAAARGLPSVVHGRGSDVLLVREDPALRAALVQALGAAAGWCAVSLDLVAALDELAGDQRGVLTPNGVDLEIFRPHDRAASRHQLELKGKLGLDPEASLVLVVGHLIERKDPLLALEVFARGAPPEAHLIYIGRGPLEERLGQQIASRGLTGRVHLLGERDPGELARWYTAADLLLLTSSREGRPNVVLEALACGLPVLATPAGGTVELLEGFEGMLGEDRDAARLAGKLEQLLAEPPPSRNLHLAAREHSWERGLEALEDCLERARSAGSARS